MEELPSNTEIDQSFFIKTEDYLGTGRLEMAAEFYKLAFMCDPDDYQTICKCFDALMKIRKFQEVLNLIGKAKELNSVCGFARLDEGKCLIALGKENEAIKALGRAMELLPEENEVKVVMARALTLKEFLTKGRKSIKNRQFSAAEMYLTEARVIAYKDENLLSKIFACKNKLNEEKNMATEADRSYANGIFAYHKLNKSDALDHFNKALQHDPSHTPSRAGIELITNVFKTNNDAIAFLSRSDYNAALESFTFGLSLDEKNIRAQGMFYYGLGETYFEMNYYQSAAIEFTKTLSCNDENANAYEMRGRCNYNLSRFREATEDFLCALDFDPKNAELINLYSRSKKQVKLYKEINQSEAF